MPTLANAILQDDIRSVQQFLRYNEDVNQFDEYGFTPLIESAIANNTEIAKLLLAHNADPNQADMMGGTALHWAAENNNLSLAKVLLEKGADPNAYNLSGQPVLVMPMLRQHTTFKQLLIQHGASESFAQDFINTKLLGHMFELIGMANIVDPKNQFVEVDFEGFYLEITLGLIANSLAQFHNHFAARQLRRYAGLAHYIVQIIQRASALIKYQQYQVDITQYQSKINSLIANEPLLIPVGYEGHAITFIRYQDIWIKCDRREDSRLYDNIMFYRVTHPERLTPNFIKSLIYVKQTSQFINQELDEILGLQPITELKVEAQISGNCSWANVEAVIPAIFYLILMQSNGEEQSQQQAKNIALNYFHRWREWNKDRALNYCIQSYEEGDAIRKASKAEILAAILFQYANSHTASDRARTEQILSILLGSPYEYILKNYIRSYYFENPTEEGKRFFEFMKAHGFVM